MNTRLTSKGLFLRLLLVFVVLGISSLACEETPTVVREVTSITPLPTAEVTYTPQPTPTSFVSFIGEDFCGMVFGSDFENRILNRNIKVTEVNRYQVNDDYLGAEAKAICSMFPYKLGSFVTDDGMELEFINLVTDLECWLEGPTFWAPEKAYNSKGSLRKCRLTNSADELYTEKAFTKCDFIRPMDYGSPNSSFGYINERYFVSEVTRETIGDQTIYRIKVDCNDGSGNSITFPTNDSSFEVGKWYSFFCFYNFIGGTVQDDAAQCVNAYR